MLAPGTILHNRYQIVRRIGRGGMGAVYEALDERLGTRVAVKETLFDETDARLRQAFEAEARLLAGLHHPALPTVQDHVFEGDGQFLVMRFVDGDDLQTRLDEREGQPFAVAEVAAWADQLLDALEYLHEQQPPVIHRDIKPRNLKVTSEGKLFLVDFGLAKSVPAGQTTTGLAGYATRHYAPLEQQLRAGTDARSDLYAVGATLYHLLTGVVPPDARDEREEARRQRKPDPLRPADELNRAVPAEVAMVLQRAMALERAERPATAVAMREELRRALRQAQRREEQEAEAERKRQAKTEPPDPWDTDPLPEPDPGPRVSKGMLAAAATVLAVVAVLVFLRPSPPWPSPLTPTLGPGRLSPTPSSFGAGLPTPTPGFGSFGTPRPTSIFERAPFSWATATPGPR
jgi:serine/threonine protein kinase